MLYQISSGQGPAECELGVAKFLAYLQRHYPLTVLDTAQGYHTGTYRSVRLESAIDLTPYTGSIQWICRSPYRPEHKRKNWFLDFSLCAEGGKLPAFEPEKIVFSAFRCGGKGGQNVNKVASGVRAVYLPTGQTVECTEERSQHLNKQRAVARLQELWQQASQQQQANAKNDNWHCHNRLERGNAKKVFHGPDFS